ncbi:PREDICTED: uncharacterized protein K02A2.6-like [Lupinus angustifolius]|uniref:uncharacterized protein K02A2.6-like n=1 Tax=Lupinus angustifolius TaxID=3871 RepID=UPI00092F6880|nr:PREDICTED: uncharacterized protein K02A2.6-like [Lupinus angustifolius]
MKEKQRFLRCSSCYTCSGEHYIDEDSPPRYSNALVQSGRIMSSEKFTREVVDIIWAPPHSLRRWGMDILGPFPQATGQLKFLIVAIDYFTKWIEAESLATITSANIQKFTWRNIITRFGIPFAIVTDNGTQFADRRFQGLLSGLHIKQHFTSVEHPQTNGQAEAANKVILKGLKKRLDE